MQFHEILFNFHKKHIYYFLQNGKEPETQDENGEITIVQEGKTPVQNELIDLTKDDEPTLPRATFKCKSCFNEFDSSDDIIEHHLEKHVTYFEL